MSEKELRKLAKEMVWLQGNFEKDTIYEWEREEIKEEMDNIRNQVLEKGYNVNLFVQYMEEYKNMSIEEYMRVYVKDDK